MRAENVMHLSLDEIIVLASRRSINLHGGAGGSVAPIPAGPRSPNDSACSALEIAHGA